MLLTAFVISVPACNTDTSNSQGVPNDSYVPPATPARTTPPADTSFKFGVMGDTQWTFDLTDPDLRNPETVSGSFITQINEEMINHGVEFVIQVGDLTNYGYDEAIKARATLARSLYDAGIGFFPMRGNHEPWGDIFNTLDTDADGIADTPEDNQQAIPAIQQYFPQNRGIGDNTGGATNFSSPTSTDPAYPNMATELAGISYAFDYDDGTGNSATFVIFDPWETDTVQVPLFYKDYMAAYGFVLPYPYGYPVNSQQEWISERIDATTRGTEHAFVFSHQPLIASNHEDSPFGYLAFDPTDMTDEGGGDAIVGIPDNTADQNTFYADLVANDVAFYISGHDHLHDRTIVESPDGLSFVEQLISTPACPKFYHAAYSATEWRGQKDRRTVIDTEYDNTGYYIFTVDGPVVTVDYYADATGNYASGGRSASSFYWPVVGDLSLVTPDFNFVLRNSWTYSLNGAAFTVPQGGSFAAITDTYATTTMALGGTNTSKSMEDPKGDATAQAMPISKRITIAWKDEAQYSDTNIVSDALILNGMKESRTGIAEKYILTMSATGVTPNDKTRIMTMNSDGEWTLAGKYYSTVAAATTLPSGTWGYSGANIWVVLDYDGIFAISQD
ncbi:MAG: metallophosphoesterase [Deltaproteobacteria bacterium]|nr:metallophosphoesterase [Deltaproteobacteria bacterium]